MRIAVHDYPGHPFQMELSRTLAERGHVVRHFFFAGDPGPKGASTIRPGDPENFSIRPITLKFPYKRESLPRRYIGDHLYGNAVYKEIKAFLPDVVISGNAPLHAQASMQRAVSECRAKFVYWVQDLHGLAMKRLLTERWLGVGRLMAHHYTSWENKLLRKSDGIVIISPDFRKWLPSEARHGDKVDVVMNWGPLQEIERRPKVNPWSQQHGIADKFVFMYTGTLGRKHDPKLLWALSDTFQDDPEVVIVVAATGASANELAALQASVPRANLRLMRPQSITDFPDVLGSADVLLTLLENYAAEFSVPSKVLSYLCAGRPILLSAPLGNLASRMLSESRAGVVVDAGSKQAFLDAALQLRQDHQARIEYGSAARNYAEARFDIATIASQFERIFYKTCRAEEPPVRQPIWERRASRPGPDLT